MSDTDVVKLKDLCNSLRSALDVGCCRCGDRFCIRCVRFIVFVNVAFSKVWVVVVLTERVIKVFDCLLSCQVSCKLQ